MRLRFNKAARDSLAEQMKQVANFGGAGFALLLGEDIIQSERSWMLVVIVVWWIAMQALGHIILAVEDDDN